MFRTLIIIILLTPFLNIRAQSSQQNEPPSAQPSSVEPNFPKQDYQPKRIKATGKPTYTARDKYYDRMERLEKSYRKAAKELQKPQYTDPSYFGHKRPPKRRPHGKTKYCKECGLRH